MPNLPLALTAICAVGLSIAACTQTPKLSGVQTCQTAVYRLTDGQVLDIAPSSSGNLRWRLDSGRTGLLAANDNWSSTLGWTGQPDGVSVRLPLCGGTEIGFTDKGAGPLTGQRIALITRESHFQSGAVTLHGKLVMPVGAEPVPVVVDVHGSEKDAATIFDFDQRMSPARGVGSFVYDKRGTGQSTGKYTQDFATLAGDAAAAVAEARRLAGPRLGRIGLAGGSQGGWVAPLASTLTPVDFLIVGYGLAGSPGEENTDQTVLELKRKGYGPADLAAAAEVAEAANGVLGAHFRGGFERLDAVKARYSGRPWFKEIGGQFTGQLVKYPSWMLRLVGPFVDVGTPADYDAVSVLKRVKTPTLWVLADDDTLAPNLTTRMRLATLIANGAPITVVAFPRTDHGIMEFITTSSGERRNTRYSQGYLRTTVDWARTGRLELPYGASVIISQPGTPER